MNHKFLTLLPLFLTVWSSVFAQTHSVKVLNMEEVEKFIEYPQAALDSAIEGTVEAAIAVNQAGQITESTILHHLCTHC